MMVDSAVAVAVECQAVRSADNRCQPRNSMHRLEHLPSLQHRLRIVLRLNNQSIRGWVPTALVAAEMEACVERWICARSHVEAVVGFNRNGFSKKN